MDTEYLQIETQIVEVLKQIYDPEIPVNIYELGLIYEIDVDEQNFVDITMTLTAPNCPASDSILNDVRTKVAGVDGVQNVNVHLTFEPSWNQDMMSDEAKFELGFL